MLKATKELKKLIETRASEPNSSIEAHQLIQEGADITASTSAGQMIDAVIAEEKRCRLVAPWRADHCQKLIQVLQKGASDRLSAQVLAENGGSDLKEMRSLVQLKANCYQSTTHGPLGLLGSLLKQDKTPIRLDIVQFLIESDPCAKRSLTNADNQQHTCLLLAKNNPKCPQDVIDYLQRQLDHILNQIPFEQPEIDPNEVIMWIHRGANIETIDQNGNTVLCNAVLADNLKLVRVLVAAGSNTAHRNADDLTPLQLAKKTTRRNPPLIAILERHHVNDELKRLIEMKRSQLTTDEVRILLEKGADIHSALVNNDSFLHLLIASGGTPEMVTAFVNDFNADLSAMNINGYRPIELCILLDEDPFTRLFAFLKLPKTTVELFTNPKLNKTLVKFAIEQNRPEAAKIILDELNLRLWDYIVRSINTKEDNHEAIMTELKQLVACDAEINYKHRDDESRERTVLHLACEIGAKRLVEYLIKDLQADYTLQNHNGHYPISIATEHGHLSIVEYLCSLPKSTLNLFDNEQQTPLHLAAKKRHLLIVRYLVKWGANHQTQNLLKQTPLDIARAHVSKNKKDEISDKQLIYFLEQLICPPVSQNLVQQTSSTTQFDNDLDTCELVTPVTVNPIQMSVDDTEGALGKQRRSLFAGSLNDDLHVAAKNGSVWEAQKAITQGADIRYRKKNSTAYDVALQSVKEYSTYSKSTPLIGSSTFQDIATGCQEIARMIQQIAQTKLIEAINQSNAKLLKSYHGVGASLTVDLLYRACHVSDNVDIVDYLLNESVDIYRAMIDDSSTNCPYRIAKKKNFSKLCNYLKYRLSVECSKAVKENNLEMVKKLVYAGANVDMYDTNNLDEALKHQNADLIRFLCENGAKMPSNWMNAETIVLEPDICQQLKPEILFRINQCLINRRLRFAAASNNFDEVIRCQRLGADINSVNCYGSTALLYAIQYGNSFPIVHSLASSGASMLHSNDSAPISLIELAKEKGCKQIVDYLSEELNNQFLSAILNNERQTAEKLAQLGADVNYQDEQKRTALHYAVQYYGVDLVNWLCEYGGNPTICDINGDYPLIQATEKGDYAMVKLFVTKYPATKRQTNKAGQTALEIAQKLKFTRIYELIKTGDTASESLTDQNEKVDESKHDYETLLKAARDGHFKIIQEFIDERYESKEHKRQLCFELIQVAKGAKQRQIVDILESYYKTKLIDKLASDMELGGYGGGGGGGGGGSFTLSEHHQRVLRGFLSGLSNIIADSTVVLDPTDPKTYEDLFSTLTSNITKRSEELQEVGNEHDVKKLIEQDETNTREQLTKISEQLEQLLESRDSLQARIEDADKGLFEQQTLTALQRKEFNKEKENCKRQLATYECSIFLFQRQQEATLIRQNTVNFIKGNPNLIMFYRTIENRLEALFHSVLAAKGGYLTPKATAKSSKPTEILNQIPILNLASVSINAVLSPILSKLNQKEQKKEWDNISTLGNIEELRRIASDTAGIITLYYREQIQCIDSSQKTKGSNVVNDTIHSLKYVYNVHSESTEEMAVIMVAKYITTWIIDELKSGRARIDVTEPLPQQLWLCVARKDPIDQGRRARLTDSLGLSTGQQMIPLKISREGKSEETIVHVELCHLIGCVSVVGNDGSIYQYSIPQDLEVFGYVYVTPFSSDEKTLQAIVEGRKLNLAKRDEHGNILTRFEDIIEYAQTYAIQNGQHVSESLITRATANQVAEVLREQKMFANFNDINEEVEKASKAIEINVDALREEIQEKTKFYQISIDAAHEQLRQESEINRETMVNDNTIRYEQTRMKLRDEFKDMEKRLEQLIEKRMNDIQQQMQQKIDQIVIMVELAQVQSQQATAEAHQATQISRQMLEEATQVATSVRNLIQWSEQQYQEFQLAIKKCETTVKETTATQIEFCKGTIFKMRTDAEYICERARDDAHQSAINAKESAQAAQQALAHTQDIQSMTKSQLEVQRKEIEKTMAETRNACQQSERAVAEAREAEKHAKRSADASTEAMNKMERVLERSERSSKNEESNLSKILL